ncbi:hypothetical protein Mapa_013859 [Marchantia paleacea]|nr:hypothetical protein Mapa_013859 [Marchantia paleacea]
MGLLPAIAMAKHHSRAKQIQLVEQTTVKYQEQMTESESSGEASSPSLSLSLSLSLKHTQPLPDPCGSIHR